MPNNMDLLNILFLIPLITASRRFDGPSYRSNIMEGDKPILRMAPDTDESESNSDEERQPSPPPQPKLPKTGKDMKQLVNWLLDNFGYNLAALVPKNNADEERQPSPPPQPKLPKTGKDMKQLVNWLLDNFGYDLAALVPKNNAENVNSENILRNDVPKKSLDVDEYDKDTVIQKFENIESVPTIDSAVEPHVVGKETGLRTNKKKHKGGKVVPVWMADLKAFIKDLTTRYGQHEVLDKTKPVIATLEKKHHMKISDIDVDEYGEIQITYIDKGKSKKVARHSDEN